jgi:hypothetical protein
MRSRHARRQTLVSFAVAIAFVTMGCSSTADHSASTPKLTLGTPGKSGLIAQVASYDLAADRPQRVLVGLQTGDNSLVDFGTARFSFTYQGTGTGGVSEPGPTAVATWIPVAGQRVQLRDAPAIVSPADGIGVYEAKGVNLSKAGFWTVTTSVTIDGAERTADASFEVVPTHRVPAVGDAAPASTNRLAGDTSVKAKAIDSRAGTTDKVPDPELHAMTVADAIKSGKPTVVVVSTPTYCVSKFCGPITESVGALAAANAGRANFIHLEVWSDYEGTALNAAAADWIYPEGTDDAREPWVFLIGADGKILERWDNVASDESLAGALKAALG